MFRKCFSSMLSGIIVVTCMTGRLLAVDKSGLTGMDGSGYYQVHPMFHPYPDKKTKPQSIGRFGPVGIGSELLQPAFTRRVKNVEEDSPAAATRKLKKGQLIDSINGRIMEKMEPTTCLSKRAVTATKTATVGSRITPPTGSRR